MDLNPDTDLTFTRKLPIAPALVWTCWTTPEHIRAMRKRCENAELVPVTEKEFTVVSSYGQSVILGEGSKIIGERINPTGKKRFNADNQS